MVQSTRINELNIISDIVYDILPEYTYKEPNPPDYIPISTQAVKLQSIEENIINGFELSY